jgi:MFS family permease
VFWRYWSGSAVSEFGTAITSVALPLTAVTALHVGSLEVAAITAAGYAAWAILGLPAGVLVGRFPLRAMLLAMDLVRAAALCTIPVAAWLGVLGVPQLVGVALIVSAASVIFDVGNATLLPSIVSRAELTARNSFTSASSGVTQLGGPAAGGLLVQLLGGATAILVDVASYLLSAVLLRTLPRPAPQPTETTSRPALLESIRDGWHFVVRHPVMRPCLVVASIMNLIAGALMALAPFYLVRTLGASAGLSGALIASEGAGALLAASATPMLVRRFGSARVVLLAVTWVPVFLALLPMAGPDWALLVFAAGYAGFGASTVVVSILARTHRQIDSPPSLLPRVMATVRFVSWGLVPVGALGAGAVAAVWGPRTALWWAAAVALLLPLVTWTSSIRTRRNLSDQLS